MAVKVNPIKQQQPPVDPNLEEGDAELMGAEDGESGVALRTSEGAMTVGVRAGDNSGGPKFPWLQIAHGVGGLAENFTPGDLVLDKEHLLAHKKESIVIIILNTFTYWKEYLAFGNSQRPRNFANKAEVHKAGLTTEWGLDNSPPGAKRAMDLRILIQKPDNLVCGHFGIPAGGKEWAAARWSVDKTAFDKVDTKITPVTDYALRGKSMLAGLWTLSTDTEKKKNGNVVIVPVLKFVGKNSDEMVKELTDLFLPPPASAA